MFLRGVVVFNPAVLVALGSKIGPSYLMIAEGKKFLVYISEESQWLLCGKDTVEQGA